MPVHLRPTRLGGSAGRRRWPRLRWPAAHRGDPAYGHENSLPAIRGAVQAEVPLIEVDIRRNADGTLFLVMVPYFWFMTDTSTRRRYQNIAVLARSHSIADIRMAYRQPPDIIQIDEAWITPEMVHEIHTASSKILVKSLYAMDPTENWDRLFSAGIDILLTDRAVQMVRHLRAPQRSNARP